MDKLTDREVDLSFKVLPSLENRTSINQEVATQVTVYRPWVGLRSVKESRHSSTTSLLTHIYWAQSSPLCKSHNTQVQKSLLDVVTDFFPLWFTRIELSVTRTLLSSKWLLRRLVTFLIYRRDLKISFTVSRRSEWRRGWYKTYNCWVIRFFTITFLNSRVYLYLWCPNSSSLTTIKQRPDESRKWYDCS